MECRELTDELLQAYIDGELDEVTMRKVEEHLNTCPLCRERYKKGMEIAEHLKEGFHVEPPENLSDIILNNVKRRAYRRKTTLALAASIAFIIGLMFFAFPKGGRETAQQQKPVCKEKVEIVQKTQIPEEQVIPQKKTTNKKQPLTTEKGDTSNIYLVFPDEGDVIEETGEIVFYLNRDIDRIVFNVDGVEYVHNGGKAGDIITIPFSPEEPGPHNLKIVKPIETAVVFYSLGEV